MNNELGAVGMAAAKETTLPTEQEVVEYLGRHPDFFFMHRDLLANIRLPHESGKAVSLLERQVSLLRERYYEATNKLDHLLENARNNDQLFETIRDLVLALLAADSPVRVIDLARTKLSAQENIDRTEIILLEPGGTEAGAIRHDGDLRQKFADVFRLNRTHCGMLNPSQLEYLFGQQCEQVKSTALCPIKNADEVLGLLAIGNQRDNYFNINLDTLFVDFIGNVVGAVLGRLGRKS